MARGSLPEQTPPVPEDLFFALNDLYLYLRALDKDVKVLEDAPGGGGGLTQPQVLARSLGC